MPPLRHWSGHRVSCLPHLYKFALMGIFIGIAPLQQQLPWVISMLAILSFFLLEIIFYCVIALRTSDLGYFGWVHQILWIIPRKVRFAGEKIAAAVEWVAHAVGAVAGRVAMLMAACHGEEYMRPTSEEPTQASSLPPPYFVSVLLSLCYTAH